MMLYLEVKIIHEIDPKTFTCSKTQCTKESTFDSWSFEFFCCCKSLLCTLDIDVLAMNCNPELTESDSKFCPSICSE